MPQISFRIVTLLVCLLGFVGASIACDKHKKAEENTSQTIAEEFKTAGQPQVTQGESPSSAEVKITAEATTNTETQPMPLQTANADIQVIEFVLANKVEGREPKEIVDTFNRENTKGFAFAQLSAEKHAQVAFVWYREGKEHSRFTTNVHASKRWRTYSSTKLRPGHWKVQLVAGDQILAERTFTIE